MSEAHVLEPDTVELLHVPANQLRDVWPSIAHLVPSIVERSRGRLTMENFVEAIASGNQHLWIVDDGQRVLAIVGVEVGLAPSGLKIGKISYAAGEHSARWIHLIGQIEDMARAHGCAKLEIMARKGWERKLPNYKMTHVVLERDL